MSSSDSCRISERLAGGADIEEIETKVEDLEASLEPAVSEKYASIDEKPLQHGLSEQESSERKSVGRRSAERKSVEHEKPEPSASSKAKDSGYETKATLPLSGPCCVCSSGATTGDRKVDEIIDYVHRNLQEASKALASLGENFEHDSKLMYADVLARVQQWIAKVQNKLTANKNDVETLRKELSARMCDLANKEREITELKAQLAECLAAKEICEKALVEIRKPTKQAELATEIAQPATGQTSAMKEEVEAESVIKEESKGPVRLSRVQGVANAAVQSTGRDRDRLKREAELEAELARLRKENERIMKERVEYESAIQRALLRGVSSLNVEALRVLRCPPIPCCSPHVPCPGSKNGQDSTVPCDMRRREKEARTCGGTRRTCTSRNDREQGSAVVRRPCASGCCTGRGSDQRTSTENMVFVLHQGDVGNICERDLPRICGEVKKIDISPCARNSLVSCVEETAQNDLTHETVCDGMPRRNGNNGKDNGYDQCYSVPKRPSNARFPGVTSREFIDDLVLSFCGTQGREIPPICGEPILKRVEIPPCPRFSRF